MILEVLDARGVRTRVRLDTLPLTVGRGYANDLILDDPYVDGRHARIGLDDAGALVVEDLGSLNGLTMPGRTDRVVRVAAAPGAEVRVGRTTLRFRDPEEEVPPALPDTGEAAEPRTPPPTRWLDSPWGRAGVTATAAAAVATSTWLGNYERSSASTVLAAALLFVAFASVWSGIWAVAGRVVGQRFQFLGHLAVASGAVLAGLALGVVQQWTNFLFPDNPVAAPVSAVVWLGVASAVVAGHLSLTSALPRRRRWRAGFATSAVLAALAGASALAEDDTFSDVPEFQGVLKLAPAAWVPTSTPEEFGQMAAKLREEVDALAAGSAER